MSENAREVAPLSLQEATSICREPLRRYRVRSASMDAPAWAFTTKLAVAVVPEKVRRGVHSRVTLYRAKAAVASARARSRDSAVHLAVFLFMGIISPSYGALCGAFYSHNE